MTPGNPREQQESLQGPRLDAVRLFDELGIGYAIVGGIAAMVYGRARFTDDVDFVLVADHEKSLAQSDGAMSRHHFDPSCTGKLYHTSGQEIDIWKDERSDQIARRARSTPMAGSVVRVAEVHDLVAMKLRAGRFQDDYDISEILKANAIDAAQIRQRVKPAQFEHFQHILSRMKES